MADLVFFLEERSARALLESLLPKMFPDSPVLFKYKVYEGKQDLQQHLTKDLRASHHSGSCCIILHDQDSADCMELKQKVLHLCSGFTERTIIRIACKELESWYLAQLHAVETAFAVTGLSALQNKRKYRNPDVLTQPDKMLQELLAPKKRTYSKIASSRRIGEELDPECQRSCSFKHFIRAVKISVELAQDPLHSSAP